MSLVVIAAFQSKERPILDWRAAGAFKGSPKANDTGKHFNIKSDRFGKNSVKMLAADFERFTKHIYRVISVVRVKQGDGGLDFRASGSVLGKLLF